MCPSMCSGLKCHPRDPFPQWRGRLSSRPCGPLRACLRTVGLGSHRDHLLRWSKYNTGASKCQPFFQKNWLRFFPRSNGFNPQRGWRRVPRRAQLPPSALPKSLGPVPQPESGNQPDPRSPTGTLRTRCGSSGSLRSLDSGSGRK